MGYESRHLRRQKVRWSNDNDDNPLRFQLINQGAKVTPISATIQIFNPSGTSILTATATGVDVIGSLLTYSVTTTTTATWPVGTGYRAHWIVVAQSEFTGAITAYADAGAGKVTVTSAGHGVKENQSVVITGCTNYLGTFVATNVTATTFDITDTWVVNDGTGLYTEIASYEDDQIFDVVKSVPFGWISRDQLMALDHRIKGSEHGGDEDFSEIIEAVRDIMQLDLETKAVDDDQLLEDMILDHSRVAIVARFLILSHIFREQEQDSAADFYVKQYEIYLRQMLAGIKYDKSQSLTEDAQVGRWTTTRLMT